MILTNKLRLALVVALITASLPLAPLRPAHAGELTDAVFGKPKSTKINMVQVKGGCFLMGDIFDAGGPDERPPHRVCLGDFYIGKYPVTQEQWTLVMGKNPSRCRGEADLPVENVSWDEAQAFISALRKKTGKNWRLPTEAEWEYAARSGGKEQKYPGAAGETALAEYAWMYANSGEKTHPVGTRKPNALGIYDMSGNVWQWVQDRYAPDYFRHSPVNDPQGDAFGVNRVLKGGSVHQEPYALRIAYRDYQSPENKGNCVGVRLALSPDDGPSKINTKEE